MKSVCAPKKRYTRYEVFKKGGVFSKAVEEKMWDVNRNTFNRMYFAVCSSKNDSLQLRLNDITIELAKNHYKLGFLIITVSETSKYVSMQGKEQPHAPPARFYGRITGLFTLRR